MNDAQIIDDVLSGNTSQFTTLVDRYLPLVRGLCASHIQDPSSRDDLIQESFVDSYLSLDRLRDRSRFGPWLARIARNKCISWIRRRARLESVHERFAQTAPTRTESDPLSDMARREMVEWARNEIERLPENTREAMSLHYLEGRTVVEITRFLGLRENAVKKRLQYGRQLLGQKVLRQFGECVEKPRETGDLKRRVLAAVPFGTVPWKTAAAGASAVAAGLPTTWIAACVALAAVGTAVAVTMWDQLGSPDLRPVVGQDAALGDLGVEPVAALPAAAAVDPATNPGESTGELALTLIYRVGLFSPADPAFPASGARVRLVPLAFDQRAFGALMREAGVSQAFADFFALRFEPVRPDPATWPQLMEKAGVSEEMLRRESKKLRDFGEGKEREFEVRMERMMTPTPGRAARVVQAGDDGSVTWPRLPAGHYDVTVKTADDQEPWPPLSATGVRNRLQVLIVAGERTERVVSVEDSLSRIRGIVVDGESGEPVLNAKLVLSGEVVGEGQSVVRTDGSGRFEFPARQTGFGAFVLRREEKGFLPARTQSERQIGVAPDLRIELERRSTIFGYVRTAEGAPAPGVSIMRANIDGSGSRGIASTDEDGYYSAPHDGGTLLLYAGGTTVKSEKISLEPDPQQPLRQDFVLPVCATAVFDIRTHDGSVPKWVTNSSLDGANHQISGALDKRGDRFVIPYLQPGHYRLRFMMKRYESVDMEFDIAASLRDPHFSVVLVEAVLDLTVRVVDFDGEPKPSAHVSAMWKLIKRTDKGTVAGMSTSLFASATTDESGECEFSGLAQGTYEFHAGGAKAEITLPSDGALVLRLEPSRLEVTGLQLSREQIKAFDATREDRPMLVDEERPFLLAADGVLSDQLKAGDNRVYVFKSGYPAAVTHVEISQKLLEDKIERRSNVYDQDVEMLFGESGALHGVVRTVSGQPQAERRMLVFPADLWEWAKAAWGEYRWRTFGFAFAQGARTDAEGRFRIRHLSPGRYVVALSTKAFSDVVAVVAGHETGPVELEVR